jgi:predicted RNA-binding Zn ribbon-like protein
VNFGSHADRVVGLAVGLVNALTPGAERGRPMPELTAVAAHRRAEAAMGRAVGDDELATLCRVAERLRPVFAAVEAADADAAAARVNELLVDYRPSPYLARHDGEPWHLHFHGTDAGPEAWFGAGLAMALAAVLGGDAWRRLGICSAPACDRVFVDLSRNGSRRFCSTACQNRVKAAALRARQRVQNSLPPSGEGWGGGPR